jgi:hypothetical protein
MGFRPMSTNTPLSKKSSSLFQFLMEYLCISNDQVEMDLKRWAKMSSLNQDLSWFSQERRGTTGCIVLLRGKSTKYLLKRQKTPLWNHSLNLDIEECLSLSEKSKPMDLVNVLILNYVILRIRQWLLKRICLLERQDKLLFLKRMDL